MCKILKDVLEKSQNMRLCEITLFKLYIVAVSILIAIWFPVILSSSLAFYIILFVVFDALSIYYLILKEWNFLKKILKEKKHYRIFKHYWFMDFTLLKITIFTFWLLIAKIFPVLLTLNTWIYLTIFWFWAWYFTSLLFKK